MASSTFELCGYVMAPPSVRKLLLYGIFPFTDPPTPVPDTPGSCR
jgi:hypothetical protein